MIHSASKGFHDGTIYDNPVEGSAEALKKISSKYNVIIYTCKARSDRGLINGKTGVELVWEWLQKHDMSKYVTKVTSEKPRAVAYIDDKGYNFKNWNLCLKELTDADLV